VNEGFPCPKRCRGEQTRLQTKALDPDNMSELYNTMFRCKNHGCENISPYQEAIRHAIGCQVKPSCDECGVLLKKETLELHILRDCEYSQFSCSKCGEAFNFNNLD